VLVKQNIVKTLESLMERLIVLGLNYSVITCWNHRDETVLFFLKYIVSWVGYGVKCHFQQHFSYIVWGSVLSVEETGENHRPASNH